MNIVYGALEIVVDEDLVGELQERARRIDDACVYRKLFGPRFFCIGHAREVGHERLGDLRGRLTDIRSIDHQRRARRVRPVLAC